MMIKLIFLLSALNFVLISQTVFARTIEIDVHGMTCAFCVDAVQRKFRKMESVSKVQVSLKLKKVRLETDENQPSIETIKKTILDAGFTPIKITVHTNENSQN